MKTWTNFNKKLLKEFPATLPCKKIHSCLINPYYFIDILFKKLKEGDTILKYGHDIGKVVKSIKKGGHVHVHNVKTKKW